MCFTVFFGFMKCYFSLTFFGLQSTVVGWKIIGAKLFVHKNLIKFSLDSRRKLVF